MRDWKAIAKASGLDVTEEEWRRVGDPLNALEEAFRPLASDLPFDLEPATGVCDEEEGV